MTEQEIAALKAAAQAATQGAWAVAYTHQHIIPADHNDRKIGGSSNRTDDRREYAHEICTVRGKYQPDDANAAYIAAANPQAILSLIAALEAARKDAEWISVDERLPESDEQVWASWNGAGDWHHDAQQGLARHVSSLGWQPLQNMGWDWNVTHWMHLPPPPSAAALPRVRGHDEGKPA